MRTPSPARTVTTHALGTIILPDGYQWHIGVGWVRWPKHLASRAVLAATEPHDVAYDGPRSRADLLRADLMWMEIHAREGGWAITAALAWPLLRLWAGITVKWRTR